MSQKNTYSKHKLSQHNKEFGSFTRDELIESVKRGNKIGQKIAEVEMAWLRSFNQSNKKTA